jgi:biopolymer transport protein ExbD
MSVKVPKREDVQIDMAPMIDMVFLLLIFFMVASVVVTDKVPVMLPESKVAKVAENIQGRLVLTVDAFDQVYVGMVPVTIEEMKDINSEELEMNPNLRIMIRADARVQYETTKKVMIACGKVGATDLIYASFEE